MASNPVFNEQAFEREQMLASAQNAMTLQGAINKTFALLLICVAAGMFSWTHYQSWTGGIFWMSAGAAFVTGLIICFKKSAAPVLAPLYALAEGVLLGALSAAYNVQFKGIVFQAISMTILVFFVMLFIYKTGLIRVTRGLMIAVVSATGAIALFYLVSLLIGLFGGNISYLTGSTPLAIGINVVICAVAAFNFLLDFHQIDQLTSAYTAPKYMEWYCAFGLMVTLVWMYIELLRLLSKLQSRN